MQHTLDIDGNSIDQTFGLDQYDFSARYYDPATARFTSPDPLAEKRYNISPYAYCSNNPINRTDPTGMSDDWIKDMRTMQYEWRDNVTSSNNTPKGYTYVGANSNDIVSDMGVKSTYNTKQRRGSLTPVGGDPNVSNYDARAQATGGKLGGVLSYTSSEAFGLVLIDANISMNKDNASTNNVYGYKFDGVTVRGSLTETGNSDAMTNGGYLIVEQGKNVYESRLNSPPTGYEYVKPAGAQVAMAEVFIPSGRINNSTQLSGATIRAGTTNPALIRIAPVNMRFNLQTRQTFRPLR